VSNIRYQTKTSLYLPIDGQWCIVDSGTVFDDSPSVSYHPSHVTILAEPAAALGSHGRATSVRNVRKI